MWQQTFTLTLSFTLSPFQPTSLGELFVLDKNALFLLALKEAGIGP